MRSVTIAGVEATHRVPESTRCCSLNLKSNQDAGRVGPSLFSQVCIFFHRQYRTWMSSGDCACTRMSRFCAAGHDHHRGERRGSPPIIWQIWCFICGTTVYCTHLPMSLHPAIPTFSAVYRLPRLKRQVRSRWTLQAAKGHGGGTRGIRHFDGAAADRHGP